MRKIIVLFVALAFVFGFNAFAQQQQPSLSPNAPIVYDQVVKPKIEEEKIKASDNQRRSTILYKQEEKRKQAEAIQGMQQYIPESSQSIKVK